MNAEQKWRSERDEREKERVSERKKEKGRSTERQREENRLTSRVRERHGREKNQRRVTVQGNKRTTQRHSIRFLIIKKQKQLLG